MSNNSQRNIGPVVAFATCLIVILSFLLRSDQESPNESLVPRSPEGEAVQGKPAQFLASDGLEGASTAAEPAHRSPGSRGAREEVRGTPSEILVLDCFGEAASSGRAFFASRSKCVTAAVSARGLVRVPDGEWTHIAVQIPFHSPVCSALEGEGGVYSTGRFSFGPATFYCQVQSVNAVLEDVELHVERPWEPRVGWPELLDRACGRVDRYALSVNPGTQTAFFCGLPGTPTSLRISEPFLFDARGQATETLTFPAGATNEIIHIRRRPELLLELQGDEIALGESRFRMTVEFRNSDLESWTVSRAGVAIGELVAVPYKPGASVATATVYGQSDRFEYGRSVVDLPQMGGIQPLGLVSDLVVLTIVDPWGVGIPGVRVVQGKESLGESGANGTIRIAKNPNAGDVSFLKSGFDILALPPAELSSGDTVALRTATGLLLRFAPSTSHIGLTGVGLSIEGVPAAAVVNEAFGLVAESYGITIQSADTGRITFALPPASAASPDGTMSEHVLEGVLELEQDTQVELVILDMFGQEAGRVPVLLELGKQTLVEIDAQQLFQKLTGRVLAEDGLPIETAEIWTGGWGGMLGSVAVDQDGYFSMLVSAGTGGITIEAPGYVSFKGQWPLSKEPGGDTIVLTPARQLVVQVLAQSGARVSPDSLLLRSGQFVWAGNEASPGYFEFDSVPRSALKAEFTFGESFYIDTVEANAGRATITVNR